MSDLIKLGLRQGSIIGFSTNLMEKSNSFSDIAKIIKKRALWIIS